MQENRSGLTQTGLYSQRRRLELAWNFSFEKKRDCTTRVVKTKTMISYAITDLRLCFPIGKNLVFSERGQ